ncbi:Nuclear pore complex, Nup98 component (sc Nup145/Nup100/Nup116) [Phaffia rhodozyma]|uniref:Nuclear pore complex, Nup98 component (Sc Nup145/Nup100/Nup116) n=1 Tax=Phaffia rhodozyma TaxID=264483 RepID=A0A0F7SVE1_PHARH|nr:Nuclear pore complex, Nup98 component (sc Nup145/Nup100/Nup116) [Phaffia rhodozyma]
MFGGGNNTWGQQNQQQQQQQQQQQPTGGLFGGGAPANTGGGFGAPATGFGATPSPFGQPAQPQQNSIFGGGAAPASTGFGGFGASNTAARPTFGAAQTPAFGAPNPPSGGLFGSNPAPTSTFGAAPTSTFGAPQANTGGGLFGGGSTGGFGAPATSGFGQPAASGGMFGAPKTNAFGSTSTNVIPGEVPANGTSAPAWIQVQDQDPNTGVKNNDYYQTITAMPEYKFASLEELRLKDYEQNRKTPQQQPQSTFGAPASTGFGGFGSAPAAPSTGIFGSSHTAASSPFGAPKPAGGLFGSSTPAATPTFGAPAASNTSGGLFGNTGSGGFGQPPAAAPSTGFGFGQTSQQQQPPKPSFGFGSQPAAQPATNAFGAPAAPATSSSFSGFGQPQQQQQPQPQSTGSTFGGFGQPPQQQPATGSSLFGNSNTMAPASGGLFGQAPKPAGTGLFGASTGAPPASNGILGGQSNTGGGLFGNTSSAPSSGGLFGNTNNTGTGSSLFGGQQQTQQQQQPAQQSTSLFGGGAAGGGLFGAKPAAPPASGGGLFGNTASQPQQNTTGGGLFGNTGAAGGSGGLFGSTSTNTNPAPNNTSLFGAPKPGGLFGGGSSMNPLFDQPTTTLPLLQDLPEKKTPLPNLASRARSSPASKSLTRLRGFAVSPAASNGRSSPGLNSSSGRGSPIIGEEPFVPRASVKKLVLDRRDGSDFLSSSGGHLNSSGSRISNDRRSVTFENSLDVESIFRNDFLNGVLPNRQLPNDLPVEPVRTTTVASPAAHVRGLSSSGSAASPAPKQASSKPASQKGPLLQHGDYYTIPEISTLVKFGYQDLTSLSNFVVGRKGYGEVAFLEPVDLTSVSSIQDIPGHIVLFEEKMCEVYPDNVAKAPRGTGLNVPAQITLEKCWPLDKAKREPIKDIASPKMKQHLRVLKGMAETEFVRYEAESGTWVFKVEHFSRYGLLGSDDEDEDEVDEETAVVETKSAEPFKATSKQPFVSQKAGSVKRSMYPPSSDETEASDETIGETDLPPVTYGSEDEQSGPDSMSNSKRPADRHSSRTGSVSDRRQHQDFQYGRRTGYDEEMYDHSTAGQSDVGTEDEEDDDEAEETEEDEMDDSEYDEEEERRHRASRQDSLHPSDLDEAPGDSIRPWGAFVGVEPRKVQVMQASFFRNEEPESTESTIRSNRAPRLRPNTLSGSFAQSRIDRIGQHDHTDRQTSFGMSRKVEQLDEEDEEPPLSRPRKKFARIEIGRDTIRPNEGLMLDAGASMRGSFRVGWGPDGTIVHLGQLCGLHQSASPAPGSSVILEKVQMFSAAASVEKTRSEHLLDTQLRNTEIYFEDGVPSASPASNLRFRHFTSSLAPDDQSFEAQLWRLGAALFDEIDLGLPDAASAPLFDRVHHIRRKLAFSKWLASAVAPAVDHDLINSQESGPSRAFIYLTGHQIEQAAQTALSAGDLRLATLLTRVGGNQAFRDEMFLQLEKWREHRIDSDISPDYRKLYCLLAGIVDVSEGTRVRDPVDSSPQLEIAEGLDWKRALGLHIWYGSSYDLDLSDGLRRYQHALTTSVAPAAPLPWYEERPSLVKNLTKWKTPQGISDALFLLINLYADTATPMEDVLDPSAFGPTPLDYRLPWHLYTVLALALRTRDFGDRQEPNEENNVDLGYSRSANALTTSYATQLERLGLWDQAIFILLHLEIPELRLSAIKEVLFRNVGTDAKKEKFVVEKLQVPAEWISEAKANIANYEGDPYKAYFLLIESKLYDRACAVAVHDLVPEVLLREDFALVKKLLAPLKEVKVTDWQITGQVFLDLVEALERLPVLISETLSAPDAAQMDELSRLSSRLPTIIRLLPSLFADSSLQSNVVLSDMLSRLLRLGSSLSVSKWLDAPPAIPHGDHLLESDELSLLQSAALDRFSMSLEAFA